MNWFIVIPIVFILILDGLIILGTRRMKKELKKASDNARKIDAMLKEAHNESLKLRLKYEAENG